MIEIALIAALLAIPASLARADDADGTAVALASGQTMQLVAGAHGPALQIRRANGHLLSLGLTVTPNVSAPATPGSLDLVGDVGSTAILIDRYPSKHGSLALCASGSEDFLRIVRDQDETLKQLAALPIASCRDGIELAEDGIKWIAPERELRIHWLRGPGPGHEDEVRTVRLAENGDIIPALFSGPNLPTFSPGKTIAVGLDASLTGADAEQAQFVVNGARLAFDAANKAGTVPGYQFKLTLLDDATATAGQYDPAQAAANARKMAADDAMVAAVGPMFSGAGKAMAPILSQAGLATITPYSTNPDITDPKFAAQYRPAGKAIYFRTVTTDAYQGPDMANYLAQKLRVKTVFVIDDSSTYGMGLADTFQQQAEKRGLTLLGRAKLDPKAPDYAPVLMKINAMQPDALYYGGTLQAGVKLARQAYEIVPKVIKAGGDGMYGPELLTAVGFPAAAGWYVTSASPHVIEDGKLTDWVKMFTDKFGTPPNDYAITAYDAALVVIDATRRAAAGGTPPTRDAVRDAIQSTRLNTLQGPITFDLNGDLTSKAVSVFQVRHDPAYPADDMAHQFKYLGVAPQS